MMLAEVPGLGKCRLDTFSDMRLIFSVMIVRPIDN